MSKGITLSQALNTRLCHDLAGVIGTVDNCISLIDNDNKSIGQQAKLLAERESRNLVNKIKFFRCAYGISGLEKEISLVALSKLLKDFFSSSEINLQLKFEEGLIFLESEIIKATMSLVSVARDVISPSGDVSLYIGSRSGKSNINVRANGKMLKIKDENLAILRGDNKKTQKSSKINFYNCREHYISNIYRQGNYQMVIDNTSNHVEYDIIKL